MSIKLRMTGFEDLLTQIEKAGGSINDATRDCMEKSAAIMQTELKSQMHAADVPEQLIDEMPNPKIEENGNRITAFVGYKKGGYDPKNLSNGYKIVFLNYGTPRRKKHGKVAPRGFIQVAKKQATPQIRKAQRATLKKILMYTDLFKGS